LRARPEPTQLECLSDATFLGKLLVLPANVTLDWKVIARYKHSSLFGLVISDEGKKFYNIGPWFQEREKARHLIIILILSDDIQGAKVRKALRRLWQLALSFLVTTAF
jgi:hypothetical protein